MSKEREKQVWKWWVPLPWTITVLRLKTSETAWAVKVKVGKEADSVSGGVRTELLGLGLRFFEGDSWIVRGLVSTEASLTLVTFLEIIFISISIFMDTAVAVCSPFFHQFRYRYRWASDGIIGYYGCWVGFRLVLFGLSFGWG